VSVLRDRELIPKALSKNQPELFWKFEERYQFLLNFFLDKLLEISA
jgi:hypothetical protein